MNTFGLSLPLVMKFFLVFARMAGIIAVLPFYGERSSPVQVRLGLSALLAVVVTPVVVMDDSIIASMTLWGFAAALFQSILAGLLIAFIPILLFAGIQLGGEIAGFQMGFSLVSVVDPFSQASTSLIAQVEYILAFLVFLTINGHLYLLQGIVQSYEVMPLIGASFPVPAGEMLIRFGGEVFIIGVKIAAPILVAILLTNAGLGVLARMIPQLNIFIVGFPVQIGVGLITLALSIPTFVYVFEKLTFETLKNWQLFIRSF